MDYCVSIIRNNLITQTFIEMQTMSRLTRFPYEYDHMHEFICFFIKMTDEWFKNVTIFFEKKEFQKNIYL